MTELVDAQFYATLKTTLVPTNGAGSPTFTRATTKNVFDNEGKLISIKSGSATIGGARCVQNLQPDSENLSNSIWDKIRVSITQDAIAGPLGYGLADKVVDDTSAGTHSVAVSTGVLPLTNTIITFSIYLKSAGRHKGRICEVNNLFCAMFDLSLGTITPSSGTASITPIGSDGWYRLSVTSQSPVIINYLPFFGMADSGGSLGYIGDGVSGVYAWGSQVNPGSSANEYVSTGVLSTPYHGAGVDGVKYFDTDSSGVAIPDATMLGAHIDPESKTNNLLWCRDLTNAAWAKTNATAAKTQTGIDATTNSCSLLTASAANATILQTITAASTPACSGFLVKRSVGTGSIFFTRNGGADWLDITSLINSSTFTCVKIENTSVTNPQVGFKIASSGDAIIVDAGLNHAGTTLTLPILTTSAAVTRAADVLTYQTGSNFSDTAGTILATYKPTYDTYAIGSIVGSSTRGLYSSASNSGVQALDGTNTINGPAGTPNGQIRIGARWSGSSLQCFALDSFGSAGSYDGSFNLSTIGILPGTAGYIRDLAIWTSSLTDNEIRDAWNLITTYITSGSLVGMQSILSSSTSSISTVIYGSITATYVHPTLTATYTAPTIEAEI